MAKRPKEYMTCQEKDDWDKLYKYIKYDILEYDDKQNVPRYMVRRLKGLQEGNYIANRNLPRNAKYPYLVILNTFKLCKQKIKYAISHKQFKDENSMFNYIMAIVESNLNDVYKRMRDMEIAKENRKHIDTEIATNTDLSAIYEKKKQEAKQQKKTQTKNKYSDLW